MMGNTPDAIEKAIGKIKDCAFELDRDENASKSRRLLDIKVKVQEKKFILKREYDGAKNALLMKEEIQKGKNAEVRNAMIELELAGSQFDKLGEYDLLLVIISGVENHNHNILDMFFRGEK